MLGSAVSAASRRPDQLGPVRPMRRVVPPHVRGTHERVRGTDRYLHLHQLQKAPSCFNTPCSDPLKFTHCWSRTRIRDCASDFCTKCRSWNRECASDFCTDSSPAQARIAQCQSTGSVIYMAASHVITVVKFFITCSGCTCTCAVASLSHHFCMYPLCSCLLCTVSLCIYW